MDMIPSDTPVIINGNPQQLPYLSEIIALKVHDPHAVIFQATRILDHNL